MAEKILLDEGEYLGEAVDGLPRGRGTLTFADGRSYSGEIDYIAQRGRGLWRYADGSTLRGGYTICPEYPAWAYTPMGGTPLFGAVSRFVSQGDSHERDAEADELCGRIVALLRARGQGIEYNARALLVDLALRRDQDAGAAVALLPENVTFILPPHVLNAYLY